MFIPTWLLIILFFAGLGLVSEIEKLKRKVRDLSDTLDSHNISDLDEDITDFPDSDL